MKRISNLKILKRMRTAYKIFWTFIVAIVSVFAFMICYSCIYRASPALNLCGVLGVGIIAVAFIVIMDQIWRPKKKKKVIIPEDQVVSDPLDIDMPPLGSKSMSDNTYKKT